MPKTTFLPTPLVFVFETTVLGNGLTDFHETFTKRYTGKNVVCNVVPPLGECRAAAWRMLMICVTLTGAITRGRHARRLRYKIMSGRMDLI